MVLYRKGVESYIREKTHIWENIFFFRCEDVDSDLECVTFHLAVRSRYTWQVSNRVLQVQGELNQFCVSLAFKLHIHYDSPNARTVTYYGGSLVDGGVKKYKTMILEGENIRNDSEIVTGMLPKDVVRSFPGGTFGGSNSEIIPSNSPSADVVTRKVAPDKPSAHEDTTASQDEPAVEDGEEAAGRIEDASGLNMSDEPTAARRSSDDNRFLSMLKESYQ
jgi:hypothetical protein